MPRTKTKQIITIIKYEVTSQIGVVYVKLKIQANSVRKAMKINKYFAIPVFFLTVLPYIKKGATFRIARTINTTGNALVITTERILPPAGV